MYLRRFGAHTMARFLECIPVSFPNAATFARWRIKNSVVLEVNENCIMQNNYSTHLHEMEAKIKIITNMISNINRVQNHSMYMHCKLDFVKLHTCNEVEEVVGRHHGSSTVYCLHLALRPINRHKLDHLILSSVQNKYKIQKIILAPK